MQTANVKQITPEVAPVSRSIWIGFDISEHFCQLPTHYHQPSLIIVFLETCFFPMKIIIWATGQLFSINILKRHFLFLKLNKGFCWFRHWVLACLQPSVEICRHPPKIKCFHILHYAFPFLQNVRNSFGFFTIGQCPSTPPSCSAPLSAPVEVGYIKQFYIS